MATQTYQTVVVTGINSDTEDDGIVVAHAYAKELFEDGLVSELSPVGHNFIQSFCVFPSGSGNERAPQMAHREHVRQFCEWLAQLGAAEVSYVAIKWTDDIEPEITNSHEDDCSRPQP